MNDKSNELPAREQDEMNKESNEFVANGQDDDESNKLECKEQDQIKNESNEL